MIENIPESLKDKLKDVDLSKLEQRVLDAKEAAKFDLTDKEHRGSVPV